METISIKHKKANYSFSAQSNVIAEGQYLNLDDFMQGTISGDELVKYVCDKLDEKYSESQLCGL